jgi:hypothetical protein
MKQKLFLSFLTIVVGVLSASAQNEKKLVINAGNLEHIIIANDMNVILMPGTVKDRSISMDANASAKLDLKFSNNTMMISAVRPPAKEKLTLQLYVNGLKTITVGNNTIVKTEGILNSAKLDVYVEGEAMAHLKSKGNIKVHSLNDAEIDVKYIQENLLATH